MLLDPGHILKVQGALDKITDAIDKLCDVWTDVSAPTDDRAFIHIVIDEFSATKIDLSTIIPPQTLPQ